MHFYRSVCVCVALRASVCMKQRKKQMLVCCLGFDTVMLQGHVVLQFLYSCWHSCCWVSLHSFLCVSRTVYLPTTSSTLCIRCIDILTASLLYDDTSTTTTTTHLTNIGPTANIFLLAVINETVTVVYSTSVNLSTGYHISCNICCKYCIHFYRAACNADAV